ncbi:MAG TPA: polyprenyl diphosphate synthase [Candidatus Baltobacteraceae bacterium]|nr:polyprenyl diphosphate synthase [Candidatus Baltobacteraceae bacterium]
MIERAQAPLQAPAHSARHVAIIMDGNRRWALERNLLPIEGHRAGASTLRDITRAASRMGLEFLTVFAFSEENWRREPAETLGIMELLRDFARSERETLRDENVRVRTIGRLGELPAATRGALEALVAATSENDGLTLSLAVNYGARTELCDAIRALARDVVSGAVAAGAVDGDLIERYLYTAGLPDPDLLIRTGGELRVSNFLLYQIAYTELWATPVRWPSFNATLFEEALRAFAGRQRRFGT